MELRDQVKRSLSITDVVSMYVNLKPSGKYLKGLCPFHMEKTPSFFVMPDKDTFACYGCNKFGDIFSFIQEIENLSFPEAMNFLIEKYNIPVERGKNRIGVKKNIYAKINEITLKYFRDNLIHSHEGEKAMKYLTDRGISEKIINHFSLGYAQNRWDGLYDYLRKKSSDIEKAIELGLLIKNQNHRIYDRFRGRVIFPIYSESNSHSPIAFGGRTIFDEPNKYLNSPDTPLYKKSKHLYGFTQAKEAIRKNQAAILVEGYFDVVSLFQHGVENATASLGTALTENQVNLLARFADHEKIYIFYDNDKAGNEASLRAIEKMFEQNINPKIISSNDPETKDPDDFIKAKGIDMFNKLLEKATDGFSFLAENMSTKYDLNIPEKKYEAVKEMMNAVEKINEPIIRDGYIRKIGDFFHVDEKKLKGNSKIRNAREVDQSPKRLTITLAERIFLENIFARPEFISEIKVLFNDKLLSALASKNIIRLLLKNFNPENKEIMNINNILKELSDAEKSELREIFEHSKMMQKNTELVEEEIESCIVKFYDLMNKREIRLLNQEIKMAIKDKNSKKAEQLIQRKTNSMKSKYNIKIHNPNLLEGAVD